MANWLNQHLGTLITVILAAASGFFSFVLAIAIIILKHRERIKGIETRLDELDRRLQENSNFAASSDKFETLIQELSSLINYLKTSGITSENNVEVSASENHQKAIPKIPIREISVRNKSKSKTRAVRTKKNAKKT